MKRPITEAKVRVRIRERCDSVCLSWWTYSLAYVTNGHIGEEFVVISTEILLREKMGNNRRNLGHWLLAGRSDFCDTFRSVLIYAVFKLNFRFFYFHYDNERGHIRVILAIFI